MSWRYALKNYVTSPETVNDDTVIYFDDKVSIIRDSFPKSECHLLILPRTMQLSRSHPTEVIDAKFKNEFESYVNSAIDHIFRHFQEKFRIKTVSYTHLDVYKRQRYDCDTEISKLSYCLLLSCHLTKRYIQT